MVDKTQNDATPGVDEAIREFVRAKQKGTSGRYAQEAERVLEQWAGRLSEHVETVGEVGPEEMRRYTTYLNDRVDARLADPDTGISGRTAQKYYSYVRAFLSYCVEWGYISENPAALARLTDQLPDASLGTPNDDQQTWSIRERDQLVAYVDEQAHEAIDADGLDAEIPVRDRAIVYLLAFTAARSAELFADPRDDRRDGIRWADIDIENNHIQVLGKSQDREAMQLPDRVRTALQQHKRIQSPPSDDWPVFPTRHRPTLAQLGKDEAPPSITTQTVRNILQRLCDEGDIDVEGDYDYLKPHGARRGLGKQLYKNHSAAAAQKALRHQSPETTSEMYADIEAGEVAEIVDDVLDEE